MQLAFAVKDAPSEFGVKLGVVLDRFLQAARVKGVMISEADRNALKALMSAAQNAEDHIVNQARRITLLETLSVTDELCGLFNRRGFEREMRRLLALSQRHEEGGVLALIDIDDFRSIGDVYGKAGGHAVLAMVGRTLAAQVRETDVAARVGSDQFVVALCRCNPRGAIGRIGAIERTLNALSVPYAGHRIPVTCTAGITCYDHNDTFDTLMQRLDTAMTMRKRHRREGVTAYIALGSGSAAE